MTPYPILHDLSGKVNQNCRTKEIDWHICIYYNFVNNIPYIIFPHKIGIPIKPDSQEE